MSVKNISSPDLWHAGLNEWILYVTDKDKIKQLKKDKRFTVCGVYTSGVQFKFKGGSPLNKSSLLHEVMVENGMNWKWLKYIKPKKINSCDPECTMTYREVLAKQQV